MTAACLLVRSPACSARQLQTSIVQVVHLCPTGFRKEPCERLERHKPKGLRVVLRGLGSSNAPRLPGGGGGDVTSLPDQARLEPLALSCLRPRENGLRSHCQIITSDESRRNRAGERSRFSAGGRAGVVAAWRE